MQSNEVILKMNLLHELDHHLIENILSRLESYRLCFHFKHLIADGGLLADINEISNSIDRMREAKRRRERITEIELQRIRLNGREDLVQLNKELRSLKKSSSSDGLELTRIVKLALVRRFIDVVDEFHSLVCMPDIIAECGSLSLLKYCSNRYALDTDDSLTSAIYEKNIDMVNWLLERKTEDYDDALTCAVEARDVDILRSILHYTEGYDLHELTLIAINGAPLSIIKELLSRGNLYNTDEFIEHAILFSEPELVEFLVELTGNTNFEYWFEIAALDSEFEIADYFIKRGAKNVEEVAKEAAKLGYEDVLEYLDKL